MTLFLANTRVREEREGDLRAQIAALSVGAERLLAIVKSSGRKTVEAAMDGLKNYAERLMIAALKELRPGTYRAEDFLDDDGFGTGPIPIHVAIRIGGGNAIVDFTGSAPQVRGSVNANYAITLSATFYVMKCLAAEAVPANEGLMRPIKLIAPSGIDRQRVGSCRGRGRQRRDLAADCRCSVSRARQGCAGSHSGGEFRLDVESHGRRLRSISRSAFFLLRNYRGRRGRARRAGPARRASTLT